MLKNWFSDLFGLLFPTLCNACGTPLFQGEKLICTKCLYDLPYTDYHLHEENRVARQLWGRVPIYHAMAMLYYRKGGKVQRLIHALKYDGKTEIGEFLGEMLGKRLQMNAKYQDVCMVIPVPLHPKKLRIRGYNQSYFIAKGIAKSLEIAVNEETLIRLIATESQTKKSRYNRYENMQAVFKVVNQQALAQKHVLLVDDVLTTGATLEACVEALLEVGINRVSIATLAFAE